MGAGQAGVRMVLRLTRNELFRVRFSALALGGMIMEQQLIDAINGVTDILWWISLWLFISLFKSSSATVVLKEKERR